MVRSLMKISSRGKNISVPGSGATSCNNDIAKFYHIDLICPDFYYLDYLMGTGFKPRQLFYFVYILSGERSGIIRWKLFISGFPTELG